MGGCVWQWLSRRRDMLGQGMAEFTLVVPVFILFVFGIIQVALIYQTNSAITQAASDAVHVTSAQADSDASNSHVTYAYWQSDLPALAAARAALAGQNLNRVISIDIFASQGNGSLLTQVITGSYGISGVNPTAAQPDSVALDNRYTPLQGTAGYTSTCNVDGYFALAKDGSIGSDLPDQFTSPPPSYKVCALPWNGQPYDGTSNLNGRNALRCSENMVGVKIKYAYSPLPFLPQFKITLVGRDSASLEPTIPSYAGDPLSC